MLYWVPHCSIALLKSPRPSLLIKRAALGNLKTSFHCTHRHRFFPLKKEFFRIPPSPFSQRELHILTKPSLLRKEGCNRPTRCSEPLRYKVGGPSKVSPYCAGWDRLEMRITANKKTQSGIVTFICNHLHFNDCQKTVYTSASLPYQSFIFI